jgi:integrase
MRVSGASHRLNSRQNDKRTQKRKNGKHWRGDSDRKHVTSREIERLIEATKGNRNEVRDRCLLLLMFRHGLRVSEACRIKLDQVDTESRVLHVAPASLYENQGSTKRSFFCLELSNQSRSA